MLEYPVAALAAGPVDRVLVVLGARADLIRHRADLSPAEIVICRDWAAGQAASLRTGVQVAVDRGADAIVVALGDQPWLSTDAVRAVVDARAPGVQAVRATYGGRPGHPTLLERGCFDELLRLTGDSGGRDVLRKARTRFIACDARGTDSDVDRPSDLCDTGRTGVL